MSRHKQWALCLGLSVLFLLPVVVAEARPAKLAPPSPQVRAAQLVGQGVMALATRDFAGAYRALAEAYRLQPSHDTLYQLGIVAWSEGQSLMAQDILRRYLADPASADSGEKRSEAQRIVSQLPRSSAEAWLSTLQTGLVFVDDRLLGQLPLSLPLLLSPGEHRLRVESAGPPAQSLSLSLTVSAGQIVAVREAAPELKSVPLPKLILQRTPVGASATAARPEAERARLAARLAQLGIGLSTVVSDEPPASCDLSCLSGLAREQSAEFAVKWLTADPASPARLAIVDPEVEAIAVQERLASLDGAGAGPDEPWLAALPALLQRARDRGRGVLQLDTTPAGCQVQQGERSLGTTPLRRSLFVGPAELEVSCPGLPKETLRVEIKAAAPTVHSLSPRPPAPPLLPALPPRRMPRPVWRLALGASTLAVGLGLVGLGGSALSISGRCIEPIAPPVQACPRFYETAAAGGALLGLGAALSLSGTLLLAWPGRLSRTEVAAR